MNQNLTFQRRHNARHGFQPNSTDDIKKRWLKYGYKLPDNFVYINTRTPITAYDLVNGKNVTMTNIQFNKLNTVKK